MPTSVKELVQLYESSPNRISTTEGDSKDAAGHMSPELTEPLRTITGRPARFLHHARDDHGGPRRNIHPWTPTSSSLIPDSTTTAFDTTRTDTLIQYDIRNDSSDTPTANLFDLHYHHTSRDQTGRPGIGDDEEHLLHTYPPRHHRRSKAKHVRGHVPVPVTTLFSRDAAPLHLPYLDEYLSKLPKPSFFRTSFGAQDTPKMFEPMERLDRLGESLDDLEVNSKATPFWRDRKTLLGSSINFIIGVLGSSALAPFYSLQGVFNTVQIFALILSTIVPVSGKNLDDKWRKLFLGTIPNVLALNFASVLTQSLLFLLLFMSIAAALLYYFYRATIGCDRYNTIEGLQQIEAPGSRWGLVIVTFLLTVIYLPMSTMAVHVLIWSQDLWVVPNPYVNATSSLPIVPPLGPSDVFRDPLDFCWTTTMKRNEVNYAPAVIVLSVIIFALLTIWFPLALRRAIRQSAPKVDKFTELGRPRPILDMDSEYHRLLSRDKNPFAFLYSAFRRGWGTYESTYLFAKLSTLVIIAVIDTDNCLFRSRSRTLIPVVRQILLLVSTIAFFLAQCFFAPFLDPVNNASEWTSRLNYVTTSTTALLIALNVPGKDVIDTYVLYSIYIVTYGLSFYFTIINTAIMQRFVKRITRRIDFSIDIFSPRLDISSSSIHLKRRIWQEVISTLLLTDPETRIPEKQTIAYAQARDSEYPPYLLNFAGTPGERHAENLKILREVGTSVYARAVGLLSGPDKERYRYLEKEIQQHYVGPDSYWKNPQELNIIHCSNFFGNAWWIPFPPSLVMCYDDGRMAVIQEASVLETYITQNSDPDIVKRKHVRIALRALENQVVIWPYNHIKHVGQQSLWCCARGRYSARTSTHFRSCVLRIERKGKLNWQGIEIGSGFQVELEYTKRVKVSGEVIGLTEDFDLTPSLAKFLELNQDLIHVRSQAIEEKFFAYRRFHWKECQWKDHVLSYRFLIRIYDQPREPKGLAKSLIEHEHDSRIRRLLAYSDPIFEETYLRYSSVASTESAAWWYIFWDDFWRRNHNTISALALHAADFNPHYPTSIAYTPLPRAALETFLSQRGLLNHSPKWNDWFYHGFLNKVYLRLNETVFTSQTGKAVKFHIGYGSRELDMDEVDRATHAGSSQLGTGAGTDHDVSWIRARPVYRWEGILSDPLREGHNRRAWLSKLGAWLGLTPIWRGSTSTSGLAVDVKLDENGNYVLQDSPGRDEYSD